MPDGGVTVAGSGWRWLLRERKKSEERTVIVGGGGLLRKDKRMVVCRGGKSFFDGDGGVKILRSQKIFV
jgi:hypothetical protein